MATGVVRWFHESHGYGFIESADTTNPLYFRHLDLVGRGYRTARAGQKVRYVVREQDQVHRAVEIELL